MGDKRRRLMNSRHEFALVVEEIEGEETADGFSAKRRAELHAEWEEKYPDGEGETSIGLLYQWVIVTDEDGRAMGTFYLKSADGECYQMFLVAPRVGAKPNPYDGAPISDVAWRKGDATSEEYLPTPDGYRHMGNPKRPEDTRPHRPDTGELDYGSWNYEVRAAGSGFWDAKKNPGQRPVTRVIPLPTNDGDTQFRFRMGKHSRAIRGSKLSQVLFQFRQAGIQHVKYSTLLKALERAS